MLHPSLLVCGPQAGWPDDMELSRLKAFLLNEPLLQPLLSAIRDLPKLWHSLTRCAPELSASGGLDMLRSLVQWIDIEDRFQRDSNPPNIISTPLTVIIQIVQYFQYLRHNGFTHADILRSAQAGGVQGFCSGLLAATALACSKDEAEVTLYAGVAIRLAVCIGAFVDLDGRFAEPPSSTVSVAVRWKSEASKKDLDRIMKSHPDAYVSVISDSNSVSITSNVSNNSLSRDLASCNLIVAPVKIDGRFHCWKRLNSAMLKINEICATDRDLQFPPAERALLPIRSNVDGRIVRDGSLHQLTLRCILTEVSNWHATLAAAVADIKSSTIVVLGLSDAVPYSLIRSTGCSLTRVSNLPFEPRASIPLSTTLQGSHSNDGSLRYPDNAIAIVGMACKFPGADSVNEFWENMRAGASFAEEIPASRFAIHGHRRTLDTKRGSFFGNFIRDPDAFDHRFFKKSSREAVQTDPQQRLLLQCAYQAIESSGYFGEREDLRSEDIGCYIGVCANDYNDHIASHAPTAFSSLGTLRAFLSGKISHYFGWTGPSITFDTACSSSLVAIHEACKAIQLGECSRAVAGGVNILTNPYFYQNLKAGGFLSPTGPTKAFDSKADGYCRGEGVGLVVLKKLSTAEIEHDHILGVIGGSAVNQNSNSSAITVPVSQSQIQLYERVAAMSGIDPKEVSYVEAHGTGTPVGDPIEVQSLRQVFGGAERAVPLHLGSVKGNIGHTEAASGVAGLIKTILMMQYGQIPRQANFESLNPKIKGLDASHMIVPKVTNDWDTDLHIACVNNYGAAGSNAAAIICQPPKVSLQKHQSLSRYPIMIFAHSLESLEAYRNAILKECVSVPLGDLAYNLAIKQNPSFPNLVALTASDTALLQEHLKETEAVELPKRPKPLVLVFGGQESASVSLSKEMYSSSTLLRSHLDNCDSILRSAGFESLYPGIFDPEPEQDVVRLHSMLFSLQYSIAKSWLDSGAQVETVIGHSFGQFTALCISGSLTLEDGLRLAVGRAVLVQKHWGSEAGKMIALEIDAAAATKLAVEYGAEVACFNGPSQVIVGSAASVDRLAEFAAAHSHKYKRLNVTNGFHSQYTEPLLAGLANLAEQLEFESPKITLETCSKGERWPKADADTILSHTRGPVYFQEAVERISDRLGPCTWLEASSATSVTSMVRRALGPVASRDHNFIPVQLNVADSVGSLADVTINLWKLGHTVQFWTYHRSQMNEYSHINLPPYQFEKTRHWLDCTDHGSSLSPEEPTKSEADRPLLSILSEKDGEAVFIINPKSSQFGYYVQGHAVLGAPLCPAPLFVELVAQAAARRVHEDALLVPRIENLDILAPLGYDVARSITLKLAPTSNDKLTATFIVESRDSQNKADSSVVHATGTVVLRKTDDSETFSNFSRYQRLTGEAKYNAIFLDPEAEQIRGHMVYKVFSRVVNYADHYKGVRTIAAREHEVAAHIKMPVIEDDTGSAERSCHPLTMDNVIQVAGLHVNCFAPCLDNEVFVSTKVDLVQPSAEFLQANHNEQEWVVFSSFSRISEKVILNDIFVFNDVTKSIVLMILGARFTKVLISSLARVLSKANQSQNLSITPTLKSEASSVPSFQPKEAILSDTVKSKIQPANARDLFAEIQGLLSKAVDLPKAMVKRESTPDDLGIDSLMVTEVLSDIQQTFELEIPQKDFMVLSNVQALCDYLNRHIGGGSVSEMSRPISESSSGVGGIGTPATELDDSDLQVDEQISRLAKLVTDHLETNTVLVPESKLADEGMDSLIGVELLNDIEKLFGSPVQMEQMSVESTFGDLCKLAFPKRRATQSPAKTEKAPAATPPQESKQNQRDIDLIPATLIDTQYSFEAIRYDYIDYAKETGFSTFWSQCYPAQAKLVLAYVVEAFAALRCPLDSLKAGEDLPPIQYEQKHKLLVEQLYEILIDASLISRSGEAFCRTSRVVDKTSSYQLLDAILQDFPQHISEHKLLHITGSRLADCLSGTADPLQLLFRSKENRELLEDVYTNGPMYAAITKQLGSFFEKSFAGIRGKVNILELGGGTGGTTKYILNHLTRLGVDFDYTFTDISGSLVTAAKKKFSRYNNVDFKVIDIEKTPSPELQQRYHAVLSTNCIHATQDLTKSLANILKMLRPDGFLSLVEFTRNLFWFDLVFGLLDGWWFFKDGRTHVLADESFWETSMKRAGFKHASWTCGDSLESNTLRIIVGFPEANKLDFQRQNADIETVSYAQVDQTSLRADIYYPPTAEIPKQESWPVALMIHGGGHVMLSRKDVRPKQTRYLHEHMHLPISIDYRLCPEVNLVDGPMKDVCTALSWARSTLPHLALRYPGLKIDGERVLVVGWSTGGTLAMSLGWTAIPRGIKPPDAILAFYCPTDYGADCWKQANFPKGSAEAANSDYDLLEGVQDIPITSYNVPPKSFALGGWMSPSDSRSRIVLHMNWKGQALPVLVNGLPSKASSVPEKRDYYANLPQPNEDQIASISPLEQVRRGRYRTPTYLVHGTKDDLIPWQQSQEFADALKAQGVPAGIEIVEGKVHLFDLYRDADGKGWESVQKGYEFCFQQGR
ncbi:hypothetical protein ACLMJK_003646 [Lecanora helva]